MHFDSMVSLSTGYFIILHSCLCIFLKSWSKLNNALKINDFKSIIHEPYNHWVGLAQYIEIIIISQMSKTANFHTFSMRLLTLTLFSRSQATRLYPHAVKIYRGSKNTPTTSQQTRQSRLFLIWKSVSFLIVNFFYF